MTQTTNADIINIMKNKKLFNSDLWIEELIKAYENSSIFRRPKRDPATQALRDAALGHPEYDSPYPSYEKLVEKHTNERITYYRLDASVSYGYELYRHKRNGK